MELVSAEEWQSKKYAERAESTHPCNNHNINICMCKGACSCHWRKTHLKCKIWDGGMYHLINGVLYLDKCANRRRILSFCLDGMHVDNSFYKSIVTALPMFIVR